jgi:hypothetical protein
MLPHSKIIDYIQTDKEPWMLLQLKWRVEKRKANKG